MTEEQMARYIRVCRGWPDPQAGNFQLLRLCTGMRRGEVGLYTLQRLMTHKSPMMTQRYAPLARRDPQAWRERHVPPRGRGGGGGEGDDEITGCGGGA